MRKPTLALLCLLVLSSSAAVFTLRGQEGSTSSSAGTPIVTRGSDLEQAERLFAEGSYGLALQAFEQLDPATLSMEEGRWVDFRRADAAWRSAAATPSSDKTRLDRAREALEAMVNAATREEQRDRTWAEAEESLGDFWWTPRQSRNWGQAWPHYERALDWWAGSRDLETARQRWLNIIFTAARPPHVEPYYSYGYYGNQLPLPHLENAIRIASDPADRAHANYLLGMTLRHHGADQRTHHRVIEAFEQAIEAGPSTPWYDDALFQYGEWLARLGQLVRTPSGVRTEPDYARALELYERILRDFRKGESRYYDQAKNRIDAITRPSLSLSVSNVFLPGSEIRYQLNWRNVGQVQLNLYEVDLTGDIDFPSDPDNSRQWLQRIDLGRKQPVDSWTYRTNDSGKHIPGGQDLAFEDSTPPGAYVLEAQAGGQSARDLVLVTQSSLVVKTSAERTLVYFCNALNGSPLEGGDVVLWMADRDNRFWRWQSLTARTDGEGLAVFETPGDSRTRQLFVAARHADDQAFSLGQSWNRGGAEDPWRLYVFTDRPAYRPEEEVQWKLLARRVRRDGFEDHAERYSTPASERLRYVIRNPQGAEVDAGELLLNEFGSAWASLKLGASLPLGEYRVLFEHQGKNVGSAVMFRMEEYKLPEFKVSVETARQDGRPRTFRVGDVVEAEVASEFYFGGPVAGASVEVVVYQKPLYVWWNPPRAFPWFYEDLNSSRRFGWYGQGQIVHRETLRSDENGRAQVRFETPPNAAQDFQYTIEARVVDSSRREVVGRGDVRVSRQRYFAFVRTDHHLYRPSDRVEVEIRTVDANEQPLSEDGRLTVTRDRWVEVWLDPKGREVTGEALDRARRDDSTFPAPPLRTGDPGWRLKSRGYESEQVLTRLVGTGEDGLAQIAFTPAEQGFYRVTWSADEDQPYPVRAEATVWVADRDTSHLGYHQSGVEILVDQDTVRTGQTAPIMLSVPVRDSYVLFTVEAEGLIEHRLVHVTGTVKLLELEIGEHFVPNVFLQAALVRDGELSVDSKQIIVPPVDNFLEVEVQTDREAYEPGDRGRFVVTTRDHDGKPVAAEVALSLVDESVFYIQKSYAGDPRQFFYGTKRPNRVQLNSTFQQKRYAKLARDEKGVWIEVPADVTSESEERDQDRLIAPSRQRSDMKRAVAKMEGDAAFADESRAQAPAPAAMELMGAGALREEQAAGEGGVVEVRSDFRSTALWLPDLMTDESGRGEVEVRFPDSLTTWKATARVNTTGNRFGTAESSVRTRKPLIVRLQAPRFFVVGDEVTTSAVINNNTDTPQRVDLTLEAEGLEVAGLLLNGKVVSSQDASVTVPANAETRVDWQVSVRAAGDALLRVAARGSSHSDAMEREYRVYEHGVDKLLVRAGKVRGDDVRVSLDLPRHRPGSARMSVQVTPSMAVTMLDALPYLIDYPYGCTEQTMSRFLPAAITARTLETMGLDREAIAGRIFGGIEQQHADATHTREAQDLARLDEMVDAGLQRLYDFQHGDGGWGWWKQGDSDLFMTAYVVWGFSIAADAGIRVDSGSLRRGIGYLEGELVEAEENPDLQAWMLHALAASTSGGQGWASSFQRAAFDNLWERRDALGAYSRALLALSAHQAGDDRSAEILVRNLTNGVKRDLTPDTSVIQNTGAGSDAVIGTAHWGEDGFYWRWSEGAVEATSFALRALVSIDPDNELIEPVTNWLIKNRRGAQWSNTRDTAITVLALGDYLELSGELSSELEYELLVNGRDVVSKRVRPSDTLAAPSRFEIDPSWLEDGDNEVRIVRRSGDGPIYFAAELRYFSLEEPITAAGNEIFVRRNYSKLTAQPTLLKGYIHEKQPLVDRDSVESGERVEVVLTIEAKNDYEYLVFEDLKPAGLEAVQLRSGEMLYARELRSDAFDIDDASREGRDYTGRQRWVYQELRDRKVALFLDKLPQGVWEIRYELRAETPGAFHALPVLGHAMYVPEIRCNGNEIRLNVTE